MDYLKFEDYITNYENLNINEWTTLYENIKNTSNGIKHDIFAICALVNDNEKFIKKYLRDFRWGFSLDSFGHSYFEHVSKNIGNGKFEDEIFFVPGNESEDFEYLVAYRSFNRKYAVQVEINPKLIWYNNLVKIGDNYIDPNNDEVIIKTCENKIEVLTKYLKDYLCAYNKICIITFKKCTHAWNMLQ